ncbi:hypothetical protein CDAR_458691 [Caerostris darwini]|uniref:Uncharacterized protein n=1 Tax=Caerostris darwini TaxID=1538125 RepID=A0AAV4WV43_9ARAC|nr:hypothetical protein CDAR_458691 [Caerostris darwini]
MILGRKSLCLKVDLKSLPNPSRSDRLWPDRQLSAVWVLHAPPRSKRMGGGPFPGQPSSTGSNRSDSGHSIPVLPPLNFRPSSPVRAKSSISPLLIMPCGSQ